MTSASDPVRTAEQRSGAAVADVDAGRAPIPGQPRRWWWRIRRELVWFSATAVLVAGIAVVTVVTREPGPDDVVREYLTAIQQRDIDKALTVAGADRPTGEQARFLTRDALSDDWRIVEVATTSEHERGDGTGWAQVDVVIAGPDEAASGGINLTRKNGRWRLDHPLITVHLAAMQLSYFDVNGLVTAVPEKVEYQMLPGFYRFYGTASDLVTSKPMTGLLLQRWNSAESYTVFRPAAASLTGKGEDAARRAIAAHIAECATRTELSLPGCPFGGRLSVSTPDGRGFTQITGVTWKVLRQPTLSFVDERAHFRAVLTAPGAVELSATGIPVDGGSRAAFTVQCRIGESSRDGWLVRLSRPDSLNVARATNDDGDTCP